MEVKESFSYSKINTFDNCQRKYEFVYKKRYPRSSNVSSLKGTLLHTMIELYVKGLDYDIKYEGDFTKLPEIEFNSFKQEFEKSIKDQEVIQALKQMFGKFEEVQIEKKLSYVFNDFVFSGFADTFVKNKNKIIIIDYKTGKPFRNFEQLEYYALIYSYIYPEVNEFMLVLSYVMHNKEEKDTISKIKLKEIESKLINKIKNINETNTYNKNSTRLCDYCEYKKECMVKDQLDLIEIDILESKEILPGQVIGPLIYDGYVKSKITIITSDLKKENYKENLIFNGDQKTILNNILEEQNIKFNETFLLNYDFYVDKNFNKLSKEYRYINLNQFNNILNVINSKILIIFGENTYNKITNRNDFKHDTKIEFGNKILYMFYDLDFIINNFEKDFTYNSFLEIKEMTS